MYILRKGILQQTVLWYARHATVSLRSELTASQGGRLVKNIMSLVDEQAQDYVDNLRNLRRSLCGQASTAAAVTVYCVFDEVEKIGKSMEDAGECIRFLVAPSSFELIHFSCRGS